MTKYLLLDVSQETNKKSGEVFYIAKAFGTIYKFGKQSKEAISIRIDEKKYNEFRPLIGKELELNIALPYSDYPYVLNS